MAGKPPPSRRSEDPEVSFSWPGQQPRRQEPGVLEARLAQRRRQQKSSQEPAPKPSSSSAEPTANLPARREPVGAGAGAGAQDRWIVTELRRQAVSSEASLRDINERLDQLSRTMRQIVEYLPRLQQRTPAGAAGTASQHADEVLSQRIDEL